jgi:prepilin-type N-terminal cleavage/methylation domain-containing protein
MKIHRSSQRGLTLVELSITMGVMGALGLVIYSLLNIGTVLGAKNTATNTAHQRARIAMIDMIQDLHGAVSLPALQGLVGTQASGISFQQWGAVPAANGEMTSNGGPHRLIGDEPVGADHIHIAMTGTQPKVRAGQRVIIPTHQIEETIINVSGATNNLTLELENNLTVPINGTASTAGDIVCYITDRCSYNVVADSQNPGTYKLQWTNTQGTRDIVSDITNPRPFSIPTTPAGALYYRFVAAIDLSTSDPKYSKRGYKSANILLNGQVPFRARLTTYQ